MTENNDIEHCNQRSWIYNTRTQVSVLVSEKKLICNFVLTSDNSPCLIYNNMHVWISKKQKQKQVHCRKPTASFVYPKRRFANLLNLSRFHEYFLFSIHQWNSEALRFWIWKRRSCYKHAILKRRMRKHLNLRNWGDVLLNRQWSEGAMQSE